MTTANYVAPYKCLCDYCTVLCRTVSDPILKNISLFKNDQLTTLIDSIALSNDLDPARSWQLKELLHTDRTSAMTIYTYFRMFADIPVIRAAVIAITKLLPAEKIKLHMNITLYKPAVFGFVYVRNLLFHRTQFQNFSVHDYAAYHERDINFQLAKYNSRRPCTIIPVPAELYTEQAHLCYLFACLGNAIIDTCASSTPPLDSNSYLLAMESMLQSIGVIP